MSKKIVASLLLITSISQASEIAIDSIGINLGISNIKAEQTNSVGSITLNKKPNESYTHSEVYILVDGIVEDDSIKASLNYINNTSSDFKNSILMIGLSKYYTVEDYNFYVGGLIGMGHLEWQYNPLNNLNNKNYTTASAVGAIQVGAEYKIENNIALGLNTKYYRSNYTTKIDLGEKQSEIAHKSSYSLSLGIRYSF